MIKRGSLLSDAQTEIFDILIIGGGSTGIGCALEAVNRGYRCLLIEKYDFTKGTSSKSTKLIHGGVRYLAQGNIKLVKEALFERNELTRLYPHLVKMKRFLIPNYTWWEKPYFRAGLMFYDLLAKLDDGQSSGSLNLHETIEAFPNIQREDLDGSVYYYDGQFDDSRLAIEVLKQVWEAGGLAINYLEFKEILSSGQDAIKTIKLFDHIEGENVEIKTKNIINATGVFADSLVSELGQPAKFEVVPSKGVHIVVDQKFSKSENGLLIPKTKDGRVLFVIPWMGKVLVGTTDTVERSNPIEPEVTNHDIEYILESTRQYLELDPERKDILSVFAGLRPLVRPSKSNAKSKDIPRGHKIVLHKKGIATIIGGKWTTFRLMGREMIKQLEKEGWLKNEDSALSLIENLLIEDTSFNFPVLEPYGPKNKEIIRLINTNPELGEKIHPDHDYLMAQVYWAVHYEMVQKLEDVLARRTRLLFLDSKAALESASRVVNFMAREMGKNEAWIRKELDSFKQLVSKYTIAS